MKFAYKYQELVTRPRILASIIIMWVVCLTTMITQLYAEETVANTIDHVLSFFVITACAVFIATYAYIIKLG